MSRLPPGAHEVRVNSVHVNLLGACIQLRYIYRIVTEVNFDTLLLDGHTYEKSSFLVHLTFPYHPLAGTRLFKLVKQLNLTMTYYTPPHHHHHYHANMYAAPYGDHGDFYPHPPHPGQLYAAAPAPPPMYYDHRNW